MRNYSVVPSIAINISNLDEANLADGKNLPKKNLGKPSNLLVQKLYKYSNYGLMGQIPNARMHNWWDRSILISTVLKKICCRQEIFYIVDRSNLMLLILVYFSIKWARVMKLRLEQNRNFSDSCPEKH